MASFNLGETVICSCEVKDSSGNLKDPDTSMNIKINRNDGNKESVLTSTAMTKDSMGKYHYDWASGSNGLGSYKATYTATDGSRITIETDTFNLV